MGSPGMRGGMGGRGDPRPKQNVRIEPLHPRSPTSAAQPPMSGRGLRGGMGGSRMNGGMGRR